VVPKEKKTPFVIVHTAVINFKNNIISQGNKKGVNTPFFI